MVKWHQTSAGQIALRMGGACILAGAYWTGLVLYARVHLHPAQQASVAELGLCLALAVLLVVGNALLFVGPGLWKQVELPARWHAALTESREFEIFPYRDSPNSH